MPVKPKKNGRLQRKGNGSRAVLAAAGALAVGAMATSGATVTIDLSETIQRLETDFGKHRDQADQIVAKVTHEDRDFTKDEESALSEHQAKMKGLKTRIDAIRAQLEARGFGDSEGRPRTVVDTDDEVGRTDEDETNLRYQEAWEQWVRFGMGGLDDEQRADLQTGYADLDPQNQSVRDMSAITGATGGFTVPEGFVSAIEVAMKSFSGVRQTRAQVIPTASGADLPWPTANDTSNEGEQVGENTATSTDAGPSVFGMVTLKSFLYSSKLILVPIQLLQDTGIAIESLLSQFMGERLGRITNRKFTVGTGANEPQGIVTASTLGKQVAGAAAITYAEMIDLQHSVDPAYRAQAEFMFHDDTFKLLRKLVDSDGRPIWQPASSASMADGPQGTLLGAPFQINQHMDAPASGKKSVLWGDMSKYKIRQVRDMVIVRLTERFAEKFQIGFFAFLRTDGRAVDAGMNPIKHILHP